MDPNVQVAFVGIFATMITSAAVVLVAVINNRRERSGSARAGIEAGLDEQNVLQRMLALIAENERKEFTIEGLKKQVRLLIDENNRLRDQLITKDDEP